MLVEQSTYLVVVIVLLSKVINRFVRGKKTMFLLVILCQIIGIIIGSMHLLVGDEMNVALVALKYVLGLLIPAFALARDLQIENIGLQNKKNKFDKDEVKEEIEELINKGNLLLAKKKLMKLQEAYYNEAVLHTLLAQVYEKEGNIPRALEESKIAVKLDATDASGYLNVARNLNKTRKNDEAKKYLKEALDKNPKMVESIALYSEILMEEGKYNEAIDTIQEGLKNNPGSYDLIYDLAMAYTYLNDFETAKEYYLRAAEINTMKRVLEYTVAQIDMIYKNLDEAEAKFQELAKEEAFQADAYFELARVYLMKSSSHTALKYISLAIEIDPDKIIEKVKNDKIFMPIITKIRLPEIVQEEELELYEEENIKEENQVGELEQKVIDYLDEYITITKSMNKDEIDGLKKERVIKEIEVNQKAKIKSIELK